MRDLLEDEVIERFDYVFASGIFYLVEDKPYDFMKKMIKKCSRLLALGLRSILLVPGLILKKKGNFMQTHLKL